MTRHRPLSSLALLTLALAAALAAAGPASAQVAETASQPEPPAPEQMPEQYRLDRDLLRAHVNDKEPIGELEGLPYPFESSAYETVIIKARETPPELMRKFADRKLTYVHMFKETARYRGDIVHVTGQLRRLREIPSSERLEKGFGIPALYEGWVHPDFRQSAAGLVCVVFTELPPGLTMAEKMDVPVQFNGYLFKLYKYQGGDINAEPGKVTMRLAPLIVARGVTPDITRSTVPDSFRYTFVPLLVGALALLLGTAALFSWFFRRGDRLHQSRVAAYQTLNPFDRPAADPAGPAE